MKSKGRPSIRVLCSSILISFIMLLWGCTATSNDTETGDYIRLQKGFRHEMISTKTLVDTGGFSEAILKENMPIDKLLRRFKPNSKRGEEVSLGLENRTSIRWLLFKVINPTQQTQNIVFYTPHVRTDAIKIFSLNKGKLREEGRVGRVMPLVERVSLFSDFAITLQVKAKDTTFYLVESTRMVAFHGVIPHIFTPHSFAEYTVSKHFIHLVEAVLIIVMILVLLFLGYFFRQKSMLYFAIYLFCILLLSLSYYGFLDYLVFGTRTSINSFSFSFFSLLWCNIAVHPFMYHLVNLDADKLKTYYQGAKVLMLINLLIALFLLLPPTYYMYFNSFVAISVSVLTVVNMLWVLYHAILVFVETQSPHLLLIELLVFLPMIVQSALNWLFNKGFFFPYSSVLPYIAVLSFFVLLMLQLKTDLTTKKNMREQERQLNEIRREEIETIGRNLHDNVGNILVSAYEYLCLKTTNPEIVQSLLTDAIHEIRFLSHNLVNNEDYTFTKKLDLLFERFNDCSHIFFKYRDFSMAKLNTISSNRQQNLYMIIQEIMTNIIKHSNATEMSMQVFDTEGKIEIIIEDDGVGMASATPNKGIGLSNIKKRASISNFVITIDSSSNGTNFIIEIPHDN